MGDDSVEGAGFWLPSEFFTDDDFLLDKENFTKNNSNPESASAFCFPPMFPDNFKPECNENVKNFWVMSTSPQSTLVHMRSPKGVTSPPKVQLGAEYDDVGDMIHLAAGQMAMLKLSGGDSFGFGFRPGPTKDTRFVGPPRSFAQHAKNSIASAFHHAQVQGCGAAYGQRQMYQNKGPGPWTILQQNPTSSRRAVVLDGSGGGGAVKGECAGTGVFLPRRYYDNTSDSRKRPAAAHVLNNGFDNVGGFGRSQSLSLPLFNGGFFQDYDLLLAWKHALALRQQRSLLLAERLSVISCGTYLPRVWTY